MASESDLAALVKLGRNTANLKLYAISVTALWVYDYFLTLEDEIRYAWKTERLLIFVLFLITRYLPGVYQTWLLVTMHYPGYTVETCQKTAFLQIVYYMTITIAAQIVLSQRTYAITGKKKWIAGTLYALIFAQLGVSIYAAVWSASGPTPLLPSIPLDVYRLCPARTSKVLTVLELYLSLLFDVVILVIVLFQWRLTRSIYQGMSGPDILGKIGRDTEVYFGVIVIPHLVIAIMYSAVGTPPVLITGNAVYMPMMISRMIMSLKKLASSRQTHLNMDVPSALQINPQNTHTPNRTESVQLSRFK